MTTDIPELRIVEAYKAGETCRSIYERFGTNKSVLQRLLRKHGVPGRAAPVWSDEEDRFVRENWQTMTDDEMGIALRRSPLGVRTRRQALGHIRPHAITGKLPPPRDRKLRHRPRPKPVTREEVTPMDDMRAPFVAETLSKIMGRPVYAQRNALGVALINVGV